MSSNCLEYKVLYNCIVVGTEFIFAIPCICRWFILVTGSHMILQVHDSTSVDMKKKHSCSMHTVVFK